jgi:hypothetical protein
MSSHHRKSNYDLYLELVRNLSEWQEQETGVDPEPSQNTGPTNTASPSSQSINGGFGRLDMIVDSLQCQGVAFKVARNGDHPYLQVCNLSGTCSVTGKSLPWYGRKWLLSYHMTDGEVVQTALMAALAAAEHEVRETFKYLGKAIYGPHLDVNKLVSLCKLPGAIKGREPDGR